MAQLGYTPNVHARGLAGRRSGLLALLFPVASRGFSPADYEYVQAASSYVEQHGYQLLMWPNPVDDLEALRRIASQRLVDGIILMELGQNDPRPAILRELGMPYVLLGRTADENESAWVDADFSLWGPLALERLRRYGHRDVLFISQPDAAYNSGYGPLVRTEPGLLSYAAENAMRLTVRRADHSIRTGREIFEQTMRDEPTITAVLAFAELPMIGAIEGITAWGQRVPHDFSILQFGITARAAEATVPAQSTVSASPSDLGQKAAEFLVRRLGGDTESKLTYLGKPIYVERGSVGPARAN